MVVVEEKKVDLFETYFLGTLSVKIQDMGQLKMSSGDKEKPLAFFVKHAATLLSKRGSQNSDNYSWEIVSFSREKRELVLKKKN